MIRSIVLIVAMESERVHLDALAPGWVREDATPFPTHTRGSVTCLTSGIGMVNAAAATQLAIDRYQPDIVLNVGCVGAHDRSLYPGDVVIGTDLIPQGRFIFTPNGGAERLAFSFSVPGESTTATDPACDPELVARAQNVATTIKLRPWPRDLAVIGQPDSAPRVVAGPVSSGDIWTQDPMRIDAHHAATGSLCEDMESAAIGRVCALHGIPFLTVKDISNSEFHEVTVFDGPTSALPTEEVGQRSAAVIAAMIDRLLDRTWG